MPEAPDAPQTNGSSFGSMGLKGVWALIGNSTGMMVPVILCVWMWYSADSRAKEDRELFRQTSAQQWRTIADGQTTLAKMGDSIQQLADEIKDINRRQRRSKGGEETAKNPSIQEHDSKEKP